MPPVIPKPAEQNKPLPAVERQPVVRPGEQLPTASPEQAPSTAEQAQSTPASPPPDPRAHPAVTPDPAVLPPATDPIDPVAASIAQQTANIPADDNALIEKEWIDVVDNTIERTQDDPEMEERAQQALNKAYLKKRFNMDVE